MGIRNAGAAKPKAKVPDIEMSLGTRKKDGAHTLFAKNLETGKKYSVLTFHDDKIVVRGGNQRLGLPTDASGRVVFATA